MTPTKKDEKAKANALFQAAEDAGTRVRDVLQRITDAIEYGPSEPPPPKDQNNHAAK